MKSLDTDFILYLSKKFERNCDIMGWSECNLDWNDYSVYKETRQACKKVFPRAHLIGATSKLDAKEDYKPGGTALLFRNNGIIEELWE